MSDDDTPEAGQPDSGKMSRGERKRLQRLESRKQQKASEQDSKREESKKRLMQYVAVGILAVFIIGGIFLTVKLTTKDYGKFAQCLKDKGAVIYGNDWCLYTQKEKNLFGSAFSKLDYVICDENKKLCDQKNIRITPTWEINGKMYEQVQPLKNLAALSGCPLK